MPLAPISMAHQVFISHSAHNREVADAICKALENAGIKCWVAPRDVRPGRPFPGEITRAIQQSKVMLLVFSSHSNNSEQVLREVQLATDSHLPLIRFGIEDVSMNDDLKYFLSTPHWLDALTPPLSDHIQRLEVAIKELLGMSVEVTGKDVANAPVRSTTAPPPTPPPLPRDPFPAKETTPVAPALTRIPAPVPKRKSATLWILLGVGAAVLFVGVLIAFFVMASLSSKPAAQTSTDPTQASSPVPISDSSQDHITKAKQKVTPVTTSQSNVASETEESEATDNRSAFERAGSLKRKSPESEDKNQSNNPFDRAGRGISSDEEEAEPEASPEEEP